MGFREHEVALSNMNTVPLAFQEKVTGPLLKTEHTELPATS